MQNFQNNKKDKDQFLAGNFYQLQLFRSKLMIIKMAKITKAEQEEPLEKNLWKAADKLRKNMDAAEYKHIVLGLIFLKYISDAFEELYQKIASRKGEFEYSDPEDILEYQAKELFYVPPQARWAYLLGRAKLPTIGKDV